MCLVHHSNLIDHLQEFPPHLLDQHSHMAKDHILKISIKGNTRVHQDIHHKVDMDLLGKVMDLLIHPNNHKDIHRILLMVLL